MSLLIDGVGGTDENVAAAREVDSTLDVLVGSGTDFLVAMSQCPFADVIV